MRFVFFLTLCVLCLSIYAERLIAAEGETTYIFAASACPPWKTKLLEKHADARNVANACRTDVQVFTSSVKESLGVPSENIYTLVDEQATYDGLQRGMSELANKVPDDSRVILYFNFHGEISDINQNDQPDDDEALVLWTREKPFTTLSALSLKQWITAKELRRMMDSVNADDIVIVIDACYAGEAVPAILKEHGRGEDWEGQEAVLLSAKAGQLSFFTSDGSGALFTSKLAESIRSTPNLKAAIDKATAETSDYLNDDVNQKKCSEMLSEITHKKESCEQTPFAYDPTSLLPAIELQSGHN
jgi:hypothetical protein